MLGCSSSLAVNVSSMLCPLLNTRLGSLHIRLGLSSFAPPKMVAMGDPPLAGEEAEAREVKLAA